MKGFVLCADDFGLTAGISHGILELLADGRLSATGAMTNRPHWPVFAPALRAFDGRADLGVHLNLTCGAPLTAMADFAPERRLPGLPRILSQAMLRRLPEHEIAHELTAQLDAFELAMGRAPDFIDGHQHVHGLPGIQPIFLSVIQRRYTVGHRPYVRVCGDRVWRILRRGAFAAKALNVRQLTRGLDRRLANLGFATNDGFAGFSDFNPDGDYARAFASYLAAPGARHLVMCHPGFVDEELPTLDPVLHSRERELEFLASNVFADLCHAAGMAPVRMARAGAALAG